MMLGRGKDEKETGNVNIAFWPARLLPKRIKHSVKSRATPKQSDGKAEQETAPKRPSKSFT